MNLYEKCIDIWGWEAQINQAQEECAEFIAAVNRWRRGRITKQELIEEIFDVSIMMEQMKLLDPKIYKELEIKKTKHIEKVLNEEQAKKDVESPGHNS